MTHIFISYCRVDSHMSRRLAELLSQTFDDVWYDTARLVGGDEWWAKIVEQVTLCDHFIFLLSPESVTSEWCYREFLEAQRLYKHIIPVRVRARTVIPDWLRQLHCIEMLDEVTVEGLNSLYASLIRTPALSLMLEETQDSDLEKIRRLWRLIGAEYLDDLTRQMAQQTIDPETYYAHLVMYRQLRALPEYKLDDAELENALDAFDEMLDKLMVSVADYFSEKLMLEEPFMRDLLNELWMRHWNFVSTAQKHYSGLDLQEPVWISPLSTV